MPGTDFEYDIFISYSRKDNAFDWVTLLRTTLLKLLPNALNSKSVFVDSRAIRGNDPLDETLKSGIQRSRILLIVMSQNYVDAEYCQLERDWHIEAARKRLFVVRHSDLPPDHWPVELRQNIGKNFFHEDAETGVVQPISLGNINRNAL